MIDLKNQVLPTMLPIPQHLHQSLKELEQYYLCLKEDYTDKLSAVDTQVSHTEALLNSTLAPPPTLAPYLRELQEYYHKLSEDLVTKEATIVDHLVSVRALLIDSVPQQGSKAVLSELPSHLSLLHDSPETNIRTSPALLIEPEPEIESASDKIHEEEPETEHDSGVELPALCTEVELLTEPTYSVDSFVKTLHITSQNALKSYIKNGGGLTIEVINGVPTFWITVTDIRLKNIVIKSLKTYSQRFSRFIGGNGKALVRLKSPLVNITTINFLPEYDGLDLNAAIEKLLRDNQGSILHVDFIVRSLYGELNKEDTNRAIKSLFAVLDSGVKQGLWDVDPDNRNCYTLNYLALVS